MKILQVLTFLIISVIFVQPGNAQESEQQSKQQKERQNALDAKTWSLLYGINGLLQFHSINGTIAAKYHVTPNKAFRFGVGINVWDSEANSSSRTRILLELNLLKYPDITREVIFYYGFGPVLDFSHFGSNASDASRGQNITGLGLTGIVGSEWFATKHISVFVEYSLTGKIRFINGDVASGDSGNFKEYMIDNNIRPGLAVYF